MLIFKLLFRWLGKSFRFFALSSRFIPSYFAGIFIIFDFFLNLIKYNFVYAFKNLASTIFLAELNINTMVNYAILDVQEYNIFAFFRIIVSLFILYKFVSFLTAVQINYGGSQAKSSAFILSILFTGIISMSLVSMAEGQFGFIPIRDSIVFLILNFDSVISNIFGSSGVSIAPILVNSSVSG